MSATHTAGPWTRFETPGYDNIAGSEGDIVAVFKTAPSHANAALITAAPELLEALKALLECHPECDSVGLLEEVDNARAAIAKAEGRSTIPC